MLTVGGSSVLLLVLLTVGGSSGVACFISFRGR